ncbi:MAG: hypothetical protein ACKOB4_07265, partial [Acidobacteriota bacterium]
AEVIVDLTLESTSQATYGLAMMLRPHNFAGKEALQLKSSVLAAAGRTKRQYRLHVDKPELWWTWDHGKPNLYQLEIALFDRERLSDSRQLKVGIREIE